MYYTPVHCKKPLRPRALRNYCIMFRSEEQSHMISHFTKKSAVSKFHSNNTHLFSFFALFEIPPTHPKVGFFSNLHLHHTVLFCLEYPRENVVAKNILCIKFYPKSHQQIPKNTGFFRFTMYVFVFRDFDGFCSCENFDFGVWTRFKNTL